VSFGWASQAKAVAPKREAQRRTERRSRVNEASRKVAGTGQFSHNDLNKA
jgi:hypothetical protein